MRVSTDTRKLRATRAFVTLCSGAARRRCTTALCTTLCSTSSGASGLTCQKRGRRGGLKYTSSSPLPLLSPRGCCVGRPRLAVVTTTFKTTPNVLRRLRLAQAPGLYTRRTRRTIRRPTRWTSVWHSRVHIHLWSSALCLWRCVLSTCAAH